MSTYAKDVRAKATIGEAHQVAAAVVRPAIVGARFALVVSVLAFLVASVAFGLVVMR